MQISSDKREENFAKLFQETTNKRTETEQRTNWPLDIHGIQVHVYDIHLICFILIDNVRGWTILLKAEVLPH